VDETGNLIVETPDMPNSSKFILSPNLEKHPGGFFGGFFCLEKEKANYG